MKIPVSFSAQSKDCAGHLEADVENTALVMVDTWNWHDPEDGGEPPDYLLNAQKHLNACRKQGMTIIHAPNWPVADRYAQHEAIEKEADAFRTDAQPPEHMVWPPRGNPVQKQAAALRSQYALSDSDREEMQARRAISRYLLPEDGEYVISYHNTFRYVLWKRNIQLLFYVGGALNECMLHRDTSLNRIVGSDSGKSWFTVVVLEDCVYAMPSDTRSDEENKAAMLDYYRRKIAFTAKSSEIQF